MAVGFVPSTLGTSRVSLLRRDTIRQQSCSVRPRRTTLTTKPVTCVASNDIKEGHDIRLLTDDRELSYSYFAGDSPTIVFLPGFFFSRWRQAKANAMEIFAKRKGQEILVAEYIGTGSTESQFGEVGTLSNWIKDTVRLIDEVVGSDGRAVLVGAGIGAWIMLHVAIQRPKTVVGLVGVNSSVDFTHDLILPSMSESQLETLNKEKVIDMEWGFREYKIGKALLDDAKQWLLLQDGPDSIDVTCPVRLIQGLDDEEIPPPRALKLVEALKSDDVLLSFVKYGDHVMENPSDLKRMWEAVTDIIDNYYEYDLTSPASG